ncbi:hypothetical protein LIS82_22025 [Cytobacillus solani]|uniref:hypothetical protein n=1 Tax=Cytobacillus solani TaxID=1637975 RepID=UPI00207956F3|nr:hypothetical protein [Cytobacillus solani]USK54217.1 hypothetical protein LIS82_22025 [Cytobacillus solani]
MKLSKAQQEVVSALKLGSYIWTNEGENFKAWLGDSKGRKQKGIRVRTAEVLLDHKIIKIVDGNHRRGLFKYELVN